MDEFALVGKFYPLDAPAGVPNEFVITSAFSFLPANSPRISVFIDRPHGIGVEARRNVEMVARFRQVSSVFGFTCLLFTADRGAGELARDVNELLNSSANFLEIALNPRTAIAQNFTRTSLVPVDATSLDDLVE